MKRQFDLENFEKKQQKLIKFCIYLMLVGSILLVMVIGIMLVSGTIISEPFYTTIAFILLLGLALLFIGLLTICSTKLELWLMKKLLKKQNEIQQSKKP